MPNECNKCGYVGDDFYKSTPKRCRPCVKATNDAWRERNPNYMKRKGSEYRSTPDWKRNQHLNHRYGITPDDYAEMESRQEGKCMICQQTPKRLVVDHCHDTGAVRALLCNPCNTAIGLMKDDAERLVRASEYVSRAYA